MDCPGIGPKRIRTPDLMAASQTGINAVLNCGDAGRTRAEPAQLCAEHQHVRAGPVRPDVGPEVLTPGRAGRAVSAAPREDHSQPLKSPSQSSWMSAAAFKAMACAATSANSPEQQKGRSEDRPLRACETAYVQPARLFSFVPVEPK